MASMFRETLKQREGARSKIMNCPKSTMNPEVHEYCVQQITNKAENLKRGDNKLAAKACTQLFQFKRDEDEDGGENKGSLDMDNVDDNDDDQPKWVDDLKVVDPNEAGGENFFREIGGYVDRDGNKDVGDRNKKKQNRR